MVKLYQAGGGLFQSKIMLSILPSVVTSTVLNAVNIHVLDGMQVTEQEYNIQYNLSLRYLLSSYTSAPICEISVKFTLPES